MYSGRLWRFITVVFSLQIFEVCRRENRMCYVEFDGIKFKRRQFLC